MEQCAAFDAAHQHVDVYVFSPVADDAAQVIFAEGGERILRIDEIDRLRPVQGMAVDAAEPRAESGASAARGMQKNPRLAVQLVIGDGFTKAAGIIWPIFINWSKSDSSGENCDVG
jgi:hypothetical protein